MGGTAGIEVISRAFQDRIFISCRRLVGTKEMCCQKSKYAILKLDKIHSAILLRICGICRPQGNFVGGKFVCFFFSKFWCSLKNQRAEKEDFFLRL